MKRIKIVLSVGARPNFIKIAPLIREFSKYSFVKQVLVHTGQHYGHRMSNTFFKELGVPLPDVNLEVGSASHAVQTARIMERFEKVLLEERPDLVIVVGDVNSTFACALTAAKLQVKLAHVEAGLRSFDRSMPEEVNRILTDTISDYLFTSCKEANENLRREGIPRNKIHLVGNIMIDALVEGLQKIKKEEENVKQAGSSREYAALTLHRQSNIDNEKVLRQIIRGMNAIARRIPIYFPAHPRTTAQLKKLKIKLHQDIKLMQPLGYYEFLKLYLHAKFVMTDSGGLQEETSYLNIPCLTIRDNTERAITVTHGTNILVGTQSNEIIRNAIRILSGKIKSRTQLFLWDGKAAKRIVKLLIDTLSH